MPGVGVTPGFIGFFSSSALGIPGVGVAPFGTLIGLAGIPGVGVPFNGTGLVESPGGRLLLSNLTEPLALPFIEFDVLDPHAAKREMIVISPSKKIVLVILKPH